jgi:hypothetical protein
MNFDLLKNLVTGSWCKIVPIPQLTSDIISSLYFTSVQHQKDHSKAFRVILEVNRARAAYWIGWSEIFAELRL